MIIIEENIANSTVWDYNGDRMHSLSLSSWSVWRVSAKDIILTRKWRGSMTSTLRPAKLWNLPSLSYLTCYVCIRMLSERLWTINVRKHAYELLQRWKTTVRNLTSASSTGSPHVSCGGCHFITSTTARAHANVSVTFGLWPNVAKRLKFESWAAWYKNWHSQWAISVHVKLCKSSYILHTVLNGKEFQNLKIGQIIEFLCWSLIVGNREIA